jgi:hypothetical protein
MTNKVTIFIVLIVFFSCKHDKNKPPIKITEIDCQNKVEILEEIYSLDQDMRTNNKVFDPEIDRQNLEKVVSLIENCGMPTIKEVGKKPMDAIWLVFQHADNFNRKKYFPLLKESAKKGDLNVRQIAMMEDRILMNEGKPQIYGTQVIGRNGNELELYELKDPEYVNERRSELGFEPIEDYLMNWNINFDIKQKQTE